MRHAKDDEHKLNRVETGSLFQLALHVRDILLATRDRKLGIGLRVWTKGRGS